MKKNNKTRYIAFFFALFFLFIASSVFATQVDWPTAPLTGTELSTSSEFHELIEYLYGWGIGLGAILTFAVIVYSGIIYMTSGGGDLTSKGDPGGTKKAMDRIRSALLGLVLLLSSYIVLNTINPQIVRLAPIPSMWDSLDLLTALPDQDAMREPPCEFVVLYSESNFKGEPSRPYFLGEEVPEDFEYVSGKGFRRLTDEEREMLEDEGGERAFGDREILEGRGVIEGGSCFIRLYQETGRWFWSDACGRALTSIQLRNNNFHDFLQLHEEDGDDISCFIVNSFTDVEE